MQDAKRIDWLKSRGIPPTEYLVGSDGQIWSCESEQFLKPQDNKGYHEVDLKFDKKRVKAKVHRIVAQAFLGPPPPDKPEVDHLDMDRHNNAVSNLEYVSREENIQRRNASGSDPGGKAKKPVALIPQDFDDGIFIARSHTEAIEHLRCSPVEFYQAISTDGEINGMVIIQIQNPEVIGDGSSQNRIKRSEGSGDSEQSAGSESEGEKAAETESPQSEYAKGILSKWASPAGRSARESGAF